MGPLGQLITNNCPGNITLTQNPYTVLDTSPKLFVTLDRTNGSLRQAQVTLGTNLLSARFRRCDGDRDLGLIQGSDMPLFGDVHNTWTILPYGSYELEDE